MSASIEQRNQDATCYTGNLDTAVTEALLWEVREETGGTRNHQKKAEAAHGSMATRLLLPQFQLGP